MEKVPLKQRDIILIPFPFSDLSGAKIRPALILSNDQFNKTSEDIIACAITTQHHPASIHITQKQLETGTLHDDCYVKPENIFKLHKELIIKPIARIKKEPFNQATKILTNILTQKD